MKFVADLHLHSSYARATSKDLSFPTLTAWARMKGVDLLSSADFTHPTWFAETKKTLRETSDGLLDYDGFKFVLGGEVSCIYGQGGKLRRIHCLIYTPDLESAEKINKALFAKGAKLASDGRPIVGLSAKNLLEIILEANEKSILIPAHVWTPWFGLYGANSGFDSLEEAFGDLTNYIYAIETGLSSNPAMNWRIKDLDNKSIVSFSDAHSAPKMLREATVFNTELSYQGIFEALKKQKIDTTLEFFPEEGKYHFSGHRACFIRHSPEETAKLGVVCPVCQKPLTLGVMHRVKQLAEQNRPEGYLDSSRPAFTMMVPLLEIIAESVGSSVNSKKVIEIYQSSVKDWGNELKILNEVPVVEVAEKYGERLAEALTKVRTGDIIIDPGYDGVFGIVRIWPQEKENLRRNKAVKAKKPVDKEQIGLF